MTHTVATVIGEALVDVVQAPDGEQRYPGGSPLNVAVGLARLGTPTSLIADVGADADGALLREHLSGSGVDLSLLVPAERTATATAHLDPSGAARYEFDLRWAIETAPAVSGRLVHTGSIGAFLAPGADRVAELVLGRPAGMLASYDPNVRPGLIADRAEALARVEALLAGVDIVKLSDEDAEWLHPGESLEAVEDRILRAGAGLVAVTLGAQGARLRTRGAAVELAAPTTTVADTIGAGDSFMAGLLFAVLASGLPADDDAGALRELGGFAARCAAITVSRHGADPPWAGEV